MLEHKSRWPPMYVYWKGNWTLLFLELLEHSISLTCLNNNKNPHGCCFKFGGTIGIPFQTLYVGCISHLKQDRLFDANEPWDTSRKNIFDWKPRAFGRNADIWFIQISITTIESLGCPKFQVINPPLCHPMFFLRLVIQDPYNGLVKSWSASLGGRNLLWSHQPGLNCPLIIISENCLKYKS